MNDHRRDQERNGEEKGIKISIQQEDFWRIKKNEE
jgi:hypothetical protein